MLLQDGQPYLLYGSMGGEGQPQTQAALATRIVDFGYDVSDYEGVAPEFGSLADFGRLVEAAHRRGLRVVIDLVLNHTSDQHPYLPIACTTCEHSMRCRGRNRLE